jgi:hypothetical protein
MDLYGDGTVLQARNSIRYIFNYSVVDYIFLFLKLAHFIFLPIYIYKKPAAQIASKAAGILSSCGNVFTAYNIPSPCEGNA